jgi:hypothetical protein
MICGRCGWFTPSDCTCPRETDRIAAAQLKEAVEHRHRQSVARAHASGWAVDRWLAGKWRAAA